MRQHIEATRHLASERTPDHIHGGAEILYPRGPDTGEVPSMKVGSLPCYAYHCNRYQVAARTSNTADSAATNIGFRCVGRFGVSSLSEISLPARSSPLARHSRYRLAHNLSRAPHSFTVSPMPKAKTTKSPAQIRLDAKTDRLLEVATKFFLEKGFEGASVSEIARAAHASKETLYSRYPTKEELFRAVMLRRTEVMNAPILTALSPDSPPEKALFVLGSMVLERMLKDETMAMHRTIAMDRLRFPELAKIFYETGPARLLALVAKYLQEQVSAGRLCKMDSMLGARRFIALLNAETMIKLNLGIGSKPLKMEQEEMVESAVAFFLRGYRP
jgi:AcrR family transcriptional regulator